MKPDSNDGMPNTTTARPPNQSLPHDPADWTDAQKATYLAEDIEQNGIESATSFFDVWEQGIYVRALRHFAACQEPSA